MKDRRTLRGFAHGNLIEPFLEDRFDAGVIAGLDFQRTQSSCFQTSRAKALGEAKDPRTGSIALFRMRPVLDDLFHQHRQHRSDPGRFLTDLGQCPFKVSPVAGRHVLGDCRVPTIAAATHVNGNALTPQEISTVRAVQRTSTSRRAKRCGAE